IFQRALFSPTLPNDRFYYSASPQCVSIPSSFILKKAKVLECGLFDETVCPAEDFEFWHRMLRRGGYFRIVRTCAVGWVQHKNSATHNQILHHQKRVKTVIKRMFEPDSASTIPEYRQSYGDMIYHQTLSANAFNSAMMAAVSGHLDVAKEITRDVSYFYLQKQDARFYELEARLTGGRSMCLPESAWVSEIWPAVRDRVREYFEFLEKHYKRKLPPIHEALTALEKEDAKPTQLSK
ncbi:MAG TPA: hypothetical protein VHY09_04160, partial [Candidatus Methylacidiphilales bacterium]|nr:hypothetical protein [Candidatus Methylacidiphilales bacterium]